MPRLLGARCAVQLLVILALFGCNERQPPWCDERPLTSSGCLDCASQVKVRSRWRDPNQQRALDIVFVPSGFESQADFEALTRQWVRELEERIDPQLPAFTDLVNYHWLDLEGLEGDDPYPLGVCRTRTDESVWLQADGERLRSVAAVAKPDVVVLVVDAPFGAREGATFPFYDPAAPLVTLTSTSGARTLLHELGHSLFGLNDEYSEFPGPPVLRDDLVEVTEPDMRGSPDLFMSPNVSLSARSPKLDGSSVEGGARFVSGVFHPDQSCVMNHGDTFCSVCERAARARLSARQGQRTIPKCGAALIPLDRGYGLRVLAMDWDGMSSIEVSDGFTWRYETSDLSAEHHLNFSRLPTTEHIEVSCIDAHGDRSTVLLKSPR